MLCLAIRHLTTPWNIVKKIQGQSDLNYFNELDAQGYAESVELVQKLINRGITKIICSPKKRARQTAQPIGDAIEVPIYFENGLSECSFGVLEGLTRPQTIERYGQSLQAQWDNVYEYDFSPYGGESRDQVFNRHIAVLEKYYFQNADDVVGLVGHGRGLWTMLAGLGLDPKLKVGEVRQFHFSISELRT